MSRGPGLRSSSIESLGVHHFWGFTPAIDLQDIFSSLDQKLPSVSASHTKEDESKSRSEEPRPELEPIKVLLCNTGDIRHILKTVAQRRRHSLRPLHFYVHEESPEALARHLLLLSIAYDWEQPLSRRANLFLEVFGNALVQERTSKYIAAKRAELIELICNQKGPLAPIVDGSLLRHKAIDELESVFKLWADAVELDSKA